VTGSPDATAGEAGYAMLDFGDGRRLERFGRYVLDRPAPGVADVPRAQPGAWTGAHARFDRVAAAWSPPDVLPEAWLVEVAGISLELRPTASGQVGLFPEHAAPAVEAAAAIDALGSRLGRPAEVLNLFAYTGLATLLIARAGARVAHVDSSRPAVAWARRNAALAGLETAPVRWLVEDAATFVAREVRRGRSYDAVVVDPPSYGHAPRGGAWRLDGGLVVLLEGCAALTGPMPGLVVLTAHTTGIRPVDLRDAVIAAWGRDLADLLRVRPLGLARPDGAVCPAGISVMVST
jgi:23S rRNA (cytosine1962-C5)-methyltransferase